jgi:hypothetical protein
MLLVFVHQLNQFYVNPVSVHKDLMNANLLENRFVLRINHTSALVDYVLNLLFIVYLLIWLTVLLISLKNKVIHTILDVMKKDQIFVKMVHVEKLKKNVQFMRDAEVSINLIIVQMVLV